MSRTLFEKIWHRHTVHDFGDGRSVIHVDRHLVHEACSRQAFSAMRAAGEVVARPDLTFGVIDHYQSTAPGRTEDSFPPRRSFIMDMRANCKAFGVSLYDLDDSRQGIVHLIGPELGITLPGLTVTCADSHTSTHGGIGAWGWGIGQTEVRQVLVTQGLIQTRPQTMRVHFSGRIQPGVYAKDLILYLIGRFGVAAGLGHVVEYAGPAIRAMSVEGRLTICNMSVEFGARGGLIAADDTTFQYLCGREFAPSGPDWETAVSDWRKLPTDEGAAFDRELQIDCSAISPQVTWGNSPEDVISFSDRIPDPADENDKARGARMARALDYMGLIPGSTLEGLPIQVAFLGSCTNSRLSDLAVAAEVVRGRKVAPGVRAWVVPGSKQVKAAAEAAGLDRIFIEAGFEWRDTGCSMCVAGNGDMVEPGERAISSSNRNFESRQGPGSRTHLASPATVAASALAGSIADPRKLRT